VERRESSPFGALVVQSPRTQSRRPRNARFTRVVPGPSESGRQDLNLRPLGPEDPQGDPHGVAPGGTAWHPLDNTGAAGGDDSHTLAPNPQDGTLFGALVVQGSRDALMTVREVAARLRVSRATVYRLVHSGALQSVRVSNAVRIPAAAIGRTVDEPDRPNPC
jgi:excisionase family DNA binding protein